MSVRITRASTKIGYVVLSFVFGPVILAFWGLIFGTAGLTIASCVLVLGLVGFAARTFRGEDEPRDPPRAWWRMTSYPAAGYIVAALFGVPLVLQPLIGSAGSNGLGVLVELIVTIMFLQSSIRLTRAARS
jgi:hypothetical protein